MKASDAGSSIGKAFSGAKTAHAKAAPAKTPAAKVAPAKTAPAKGPAGTPAVAKAAPAKGTAAARAGAALAPGRDSSSAPGRQHVATLDRDPSGTVSNSTASLQVVRKQSTTAQDMLRAESTHLAVRQEEAQKKEPDPKPEDPIERHKPDKPFSDNSKPPKLPELDKLKPKRPATDSGGKRTEVFEHDGVEYTRVKEKNGSVVTSYQKDGVDYTTTESETGSSKTDLRREGPDGVDHRVISQDPRGRLTRDSYTHRQGVQSYGRDTVYKPDGSSETRRTRTSQTNTPLEELIDGPKPPKGTGDTASLPDQGRQPTVIRQVEVESRTPHGRPKKESTSINYSQTVEGLPVGDGDESGAILPKDGGPPEGSITRSVSVVRVRNEKGSGFVESRAAGQTVKIEQPRPSGEKASLVRSETWNEDGSSILRHSSHGYTHDELRRQQIVADLRPLDVRVGDQKLTVREPRADKKNSAEHLSDKGDGELKDWLGVGGDDPIDTEVVHIRDNKGKLQRENVTFRQLDANGNGKTATRASRGDETIWVYDKLSNNGKDYKRQTVSEGNGGSVYEEYHDLGEGRFTRSSETKQGDKVIASSTASRSSIDDAGLKDLLQKGEIEPDQYDRLKRQGPPYLLDRSENKTEALLDKGRLLEDENGRIVESGGYGSSFRVVGDDGYSVSRAEQVVLDDGHGNSVKTQRFLTTDPKAKTPVVGKQVVSIKPMVEGQPERTTTEKLKIESDGDVIVNGDKVTRLEGVSDDSSFSPEALLKASLDLEGERPHRKVGPGWDDGLKRASGILGTVGGVEGFYEGLKDGDPLAAAQGAVDVVTGVDGALLASEGLEQTSKSGSKLSLAGKALKVAGPIGSIAFGALDLVTGDSTKDKVAGGLAILAGGAAFIPGPGTLIAAGLGLTSLVIGFLPDDPNYETAKIDENLQ